MFKLNLNKVIIIISVTKVFAIIIPMVTIIQYMKMQW